MTINRGEIWFADLDPTRGSEQAGTRPVLIMQNDALNSFTSTVLAAPLTTNLRRAALPFCVLVRRGEAGLVSDSVILCHQLRAIDSARLQRKLGVVSQRTMDAVDHSMLFALGLS